MSLNSVLNIGQNGLIAASLGTAVSSQNVTNANTPGYSRQRVQQKPWPIHYGGGLQVTTPTRVRDAYVEKRLLSATSLDGEGRARSESLQTLDQLFEDSVGSLGDALGNFESAISDVANMPDSVAARQVLLSRMDQLANSFNRAAGDLNAAQADANQRIGLAVDEINQKLEAIGELGRDIVTAGSNGHDVATLSDQRDQLVREVAEYLPVTVVDQPHGAITLLLNGSVSLVPVDGPVAKLVTGVDADGNATVLKANTGTPHDVTSLISSGKIRGYIDARDGAIKDAQTALDQLAKDVTDGYNTVHAAGFALDGSTGLNLFEPAALAGHAENFAVASGVAGQPDKIAAATATGLPGDNRNALAMLDLATSKIASGGTQSASGAYASIIASVGTAVQSADVNASHAEATLTQAQAVRDSVSGVSSDEEMVNLMKYQRAYQASLRVVETADAMLAELLSMRR